MNKNNIFSMHYYFMLIRDINKIMEIVRNAKNVAIVGISKNVERASYQIANEIKDKYKLFLVNPKYKGEKIFGIKVLGSLKEINENIDIVDVFRNPAYVEPIIKDAMDVKARYVWFQPGSENMDVIEKYEDKIDIIMNSCLGIVTKMIKG